MYSGSLGQDNVEDKKDFYEYLFGNDMDIPQQAMRGQCCDSTLAMATMTHAEPMATMAHADRLHCSGTSAHLTPTN